MTYINQALLQEIEAALQPNKVVVLYGPRRVGKTTLLQHLLKQHPDCLYVEGEDVDVHYYLSSQSIEKLKSFIGSHTLLVIDEAQRIPNIGINLKLLIDQCPGLRIIATGSSAFDLTNNLGEPLTGRKITFRMFPLSQIELNQIENKVKTRAHLSERLIYGCYPEIILMRDNFKKQRYLRELITDYLYKDILILEGLRKSDKISKILQLLAFQIGKDVSLSEIGQQVGLNKITVEYYLDLLEKSFVLTNLRSFSRNLRKEISKKSKFYFYDVGVRNAIINQFSPITLRNDIGELWENYLVIERLKKQAYHHIESNNYFWRTYDQQEIDWIEDKEGVLCGYEFKWQASHIKPPSGWLSNYENASFTVINQDNYLDFIT